VLVLLAVQYSNLAQWYASYCEPPRSTIDIASIQTAIEYEYRFTEYRFTEYRFTEYRFTEYELDKIRCEARTATWVHCIGTLVMGIENWGCSSTLDQSPARARNLWRSVYQMTDSREQTRGEGNGARATERGKEVYECLVS